MYNILNSFFSLDLHIKVFLTIVAFLLAVWVLLAGPKMVYSTNVLYTGNCYVMMIDENKAEVSCDDHNYSDVKRLHEENYYMYLAASKGVIQLECEVKRREDRTEEYIVCDHDKSNS